MAAPQIPSSALLPHQRHIAGLFLLEKGQNQLWKPLTMHLCACNLAIDSTHGISYLQHALGLWQGLQQWLPWHFSLCSYGHSDMCVGEPGWRMCPPGSDYFRYQDRADSPGLWASASSPEQASDNVNPSRVLG